MMFDNFGLGYKDVSSSQQSQETIFVRGEVLHLLETPHRKPSKNPGLGHDKGKEKAEDCTKLNHLAVPGTNRAGQQSDKSYPSSQPRAKLYQGFYKKQRKYPMSGRGKLYPTLMIGHLKLPRKPIQYKLRPKSEPYHIYYDFQQKHSYHNARKRNARKRNRPIQQSAHYRTH